MSEINLDSEISGTPNKALLATTLGFFIGFAGVSLYGPTAKIFRDSMSLSPIELGLLVAIPMLSGSLLRIPFGAWTATTGGRKPFLVLLSMTVVGMIGLLSILLITAGDPDKAWYYPILFFGVFIGAGIATFSVGIGQTSFWFPKDKQGFALGTYAGLGNIAPGLLAYLLPLAISLMDITGAYAAWLVGLVAGIFLYYKTGNNAYFFQLWEEGEGKDREEAKKIAKENGQEIFPQGGAMDDLSASASRWETWILVGLYFTSFGGFLAMTAWLPTFWEESYVISATSAGLLTMLYSVGASLIRVPGGSWADNFGAYKVLIISFSAMLIGSLLLAFSPDWLSVAVIGVIFMSLGMGVANAGVFKLVPELVPKHVSGTSGWVGGLGAFGGFVIPPLLGTFVDSFGHDWYNLGFLVFTVLAILSLFMTYLLIRSHASPEKASADPTPV